MKKLLKTKLFVFIFLSVTMIVSISWHFLPCKNSRLISHAGSLEQVSLIDSARFTTFHKFLSTFIECLLINVRQRVAIYRIDFLLHIVTIFY